MNRIRIAKSPAVLCLLAGFALLIATGARAAGGLPASYKNELKAQFGCTGSDFDVTLCGRKAITARCQAWAASFLACNAAVANVAKRCVGQSGVDAGVAAALQGYKAAAAAVAGKTPCTGAQGKAAKETSGGYLANNCLGYDPASPRSTWGAQLSKNCASVRSQASAIDCARAAQPADRKSCDAAKPPAVRRRW